MSKQTAGFTIVEVTVVLFIIAILATITAISYNSIRTNARVASAENTAKLVQKKVQSYFQVNSSYPPTDTATGALSLDGEASLAEAPTASNGQTTVRLDICTSGYKITYWDYSAGKLPTTPQITGGALTAGCANAV